MPNEASPPAPQPLAAQPPVAQPLAAPPVLVRLAPLLVSLFPTAERRVELSAATVAEMIDALDARWPGMRDRICDSSPAVRRHVNIFVEGQRAGLETRLAPGADVFILTAISGG